jgi:hypothetical protein
MAAIPWSVTVNDSVNPIDSVYVWVSTDLAGSSIATSGYTDAFGLLQLALDPGTLYFWKSISGYSFTNPETVAVALPGTGSTFSGTIVAASVAVNSYGTPPGVAALTPRYANGVGTFLTTDRPSLQTVINLLDQVSGLLNSMLAQSGFQTPIVQADVVLALTIFVQEEVASIAEGINGSGRFGPTTKAPKQSRFNLIMEDLQIFITNNADGFETLGAIRSHSAIGTIGFRDHDQAGDEIVPLFERKAFGNTVQEWDS